MTLSTAARAASKTELELAAGPSLQASTWSGDVAAGGSLRMGARFWRTLGVELQAWESYATVNHRVDTALTFGVAGYVPLEKVRPYARVFVIHQHEEALVSVENTPGGVVLGIGAGIRHRAGGGLSLGAEVPFKRLGDRTTFVLFGCLTGMWFPDALGPSLYGGLDLGVGVDFSL